jgi:hypothetical protein
VDAAWPAIEALHNPVFYLSGPPQMLSALTKQLREHGVVTGGHPNRCLGVTYEDYGIRFISNAICRTLFDLPITLRQDRRFSYLFIHDLMPVVDWALVGQPAHVAYNVAPDWTDSLYDLGLLVSSRSGKDVPVLVAAEGYGKEYSADNARLRQGDAARDLHSYRGRRRPPVPVVRGAALRDRRHPSRDRQVRSQS